MATEPDTPADAAEDQSEGWIAISSTRTSKHRRIHFRPDCQCLQNAKKVRHVADIFTVYPETPICKTCNPDGFYRCDDCEALFPTVSALGGHASVHSQGLDARLRQKQAQDQDQEDGD